MEPILPTSFAMHQQLSDPESLTYWERVFYHSRWGQYTGEIEKDTLERALSIAPTPKRTLEVGCDGGRWTRMLVDKGWQVVCTDINPDAVSLCQQRIPEARCLLVKSTDTTLPCETATMNLLLCYEVFPVMAEAWLPGEASRILGDKGLFVGVFLNKRSLRGAFVHYRTVLGKQAEDAYDRTLYPCSYSEWKRTLHQHSFEVVYEQGYCWFPFPRLSNSRLIPLCLRLESLLGLRNLPSLSPWVVFIAQKRSPSSR